MMWLDSKKYATVSLLITRMANVAQLVRAPGCGSGGRGFNPHRSPQETYI